MPLRNLLRYIASLTTGRLILWSYFIWYLVVVIRYFDPNPRLWLTALGISAVIGIALLINTTRSGSRPVALETWPAMRLFLFPFCVSSFSALVKGRFILIFSPRPGEMAVAAAVCTALWTTSALLKRRPHLFAPPAHTLENQTAL